MPAHTDSEVVFGPSLKKGLLLLVLSIVFVVGGIFMRRDEPAMGWLVICFFGLGIPVAVSLLLPGLTHLKLAPSGFETCTFGRRHATAWTDIQDLQLVSVQGSQMVGFNYVPGYTRHSTGRATASALAGVGGGIPSHYNVPSAELLRIMSDWHSRYGRPAS
jgi:hypothetical protein